MSVQVYLQPYRQTFSLPRDFILSTLAGSLLADALEGDPEATVIPIPNSVITPAVMQFLVDFSQGIEPTKHIPDLIKASAYLNLPWMMYYVDPLYDYITDKVDLTSPSNRAVLNKAIQEDRVWVVGYYLNKGVKPTPENFVDAINAQAGDVFALLLAYAPDIALQIARNLLLWSVQKGFKPGVDALLSKGVPISIDLLEKAVEIDRVDILDPLLKILQTQGGAPYSINEPNATYTEIIQRLLLDAATHGDIQSLNYLLMQTDVQTSYNNNVVLYEALDSSPENIDAIARRIISDPRFNPNFVLQNLLTVATEHNQTEILRMLLQDPRTHLTTKILENVIGAVEEEEMDDVNEATRRILQETLRGLWMRP
jgi:hypothetical protein